MRGGLSGRLLAILIAAALLAGAPAATAKPPKIEARSWALVDARTGEVLASHAVNRQLPIASTTKLMTAYVVLRELPLSRIVRAAPYEAEYGESLLGLRPGQRVSVRDLLYGLILRSGNDAAYDLARAAAGSERRFVGQMNRYAAALGLPNTHYANPIGLDQRGNHSSAADLATLTRHLLEIPVFARIAASRRAELRSVRPPRRISTVNELLSMAPWINGVKTGHTFGAKYVLVGAGRRKGVELIAAVVGTETDEERFDDTLKLLEYGFSRYRKRVPIHAGQTLATPPIAYSGGDLKLRAARTVAIGVRTGQRMSVSVQAPQEVKGPISRGANLGMAVVRVDGLREASVPLLAGQAVPKASVFERVRSFVEDNLLWIVLALSAILVGAALWRRRRR